MGHYLLTLTESSGEAEFQTNHLIEAEDRQMVKYHYHRTLKDYGYTNAAWGGGTHSLESWELGIASDIYQIRELDSTEWQVLSKFLHTWTKV